MGPQGTSGVHRVQGKRVLIVEDDADAAELYAIWLRRGGHRPSIAGDSERAAILAPLLKPDVALIDIGLPVVDGVELVTYLRELPELASCYFVAVTAYADPRLRARCDAAGFAAFFEKPLPAPVLLDCVSSACLPTRGTRSANSHSAGRTAS